MIIPGVDPHCHLQLGRVDVLISPPEVLIIEFIVDMVVSVGLDGGWPSLHCCVGHHNVVIIIFVLAKFVAYVG